MRFPNRQAAILSATMGLAAPAAAAPLADGQGAIWPWLAGGLAAAAAIGWAAWRRERASDHRDFGEPVTQSIALGRPVPVPRARLSLVFTPVRAGLNMLSATVECQVTVTNDGAAAADAVRLHLELCSASPHQDRDMAAVFAQPIARPAAPVFALAPGESRQVRVTVALSRYSIYTLTAADRPMFVPVVAVNCLYDSIGRAGQVAQSFAVGIERVDSAKLAPFWLDGPAKTYDQVAARRHAGSIER